jgi:hypothetical protein
MLARIAFLGYSSGKSSTHEVSVAAFGFIVLNIGVPPPRVRQSDKHTEELTKLDGPIAANQQPVQATPHKLLDQPALLNNLGSSLNKRYEKSEKQVNDRDRFDKFTERSRKVLSLAQEEAQRFQHNYIGTSGQSICCSVLFVRVRESQPKY